MGTERNHPEDHAQGPGVWDYVLLLKARVDAIRSDVNVLMGRPEGAGPPKDGEPRLGGIGFGTWIALLATVVVPLVGIAVAVITHTP